jgi:type I restriction enzyme S subunit
VNDNFRCHSWEDNYRLGNGCTIKHGFAFKGQSMTTRDDDTLPIVVNIVNFQYTGGFRFESTKVQRYVGAYPREYELHPGDVLLVMTCQTPKGEILGVPGRIPRDEKRYLHNQRMGLAVVHDKEALDLGFLYYLFLSQQFNTHLFKTSTGAKILHTAPGRIGDYRFARPPLQVQQRIASILSAYDDLIENNTRRIKILEEMAQMIYREWFVNFRFPGHEKVRMVESEWGLIPEGWNVLPLAEVYRTGSGGTPSRKVPTYFGGTIPWVKTQELHDGFVHDSDEKITADGLKNSSAKLHPAGTVLMAMYGATIGKLGILSAEATCNQACCAMTPKRLHFGSEYLFLTLVSRRTDILSLRMGAAQQNISQEVIKDFPLLCPESDVMACFTKKIESLFILIGVLQAKNANLRTTRDLLLPKLISGEIPVEAAEETASEIIEATA